MTNALAAIQRRLGYALLDLDADRVEELDERIETSLAIARQETDHREIVEAHRDYDRLRQELGLVK